MRKPGLRQAAASHGQMYSGARDNDGYVKRWAEGSGMRGRGGGGSTAEGIRKQCASILCVRIAAALPRRDPKGNPHPACRTPCGSFVME